MMTPERWADVKAVLDRLLPLDAAGRDAALAELPADLRRDVAPYLQTDLGPIADLLPTDVGGGNPSSTRVPEADVVEVLAGRYRLVERVGRGGMGAVWRAHDLKLDRPVAVKRLHDAWLEDREVRARLLAEGRALAALNHPGIARVEDVLDSAPPALVLEYVEGGTLGRWLDAPRTASEVIDVLRQIVEAVAYAHGRGVVHCDLKPGNVLVTPDGRVKVIDLGIALMRHRAATTSTVVDDSTRHPAFTPKYAAPEVMRGATPTPAADVFSLGVLIQDVLAVTASAGAPLPRSVASQLIGVALRAMAADPAARYADASALLDALPPLPGRESRPAQWRALATTALVVVGGCMSAGVGMFGDASVPLAAASIPVIAVAPRADAAASGTPAFAAADFLRREIGRLRRARLVQGETPAWSGTVAEYLHEVRDEGLTHVLVPTVSSAGSGIRFSLAIRRARDGAVVHTITRLGRADALATLAAQVAAEFRRWLEEPDALVVAPSQSYQPTARSVERYDEARRYVERADRKGALAAARTLLEAVLEEEPDFAAARAELGRVLLLQYRERPSPDLIVHAQGAVVRARLQEPDLREARIGYASVLQAIGRRDEAIAELREVLDRWPDDDIVLQQLGHLEAARGDVEAGLASLRRAVGVRPGWANYRALGTALYEAGYYEDAAAQFEELTRLQPDNAYGFQHLGAARLRLKQYDAAAAAHEAAIAVDPSASILTNVGNAYYSQGDLETAERYFARAATLEPHDPVFHRNLADVQWQRGRRVEARETFARVVSSADALLRIEESNVRALGNAIYALARLGECDAMQQRAGRLQAVAGRSISAHANLANAYVLCERFADALRAVLSIRGTRRAPGDFLEKDVLTTVQARSDFAGVLGAP